MIIAGVISDLTGWLEDVSAEWWFLLVILGVAFLDSVIPIVPGETMVIIGGVAAGQGEQSLLLVIAAGASGAFLGDNTAYFIGAKLSRFIERQAAKREKWQTRLDWAAQQIRLRGGMLLITARFIPGGRTALTLTCGLTHQPWPWFAAWVAVATTIWASYGAILGYVFGSTLEDHHTLAFILAFGTALSVTLIIEVVRHQRNKGKSPAEQAEEAEPA